MPYPLKKMDLPELQLVFEVLTEIRKKYRSRNNRFITLGQIPKFDNVPHNDLIHVIASLADEGVIKKYTTISIFIGMSISITDTFELFYDAVEETITNKENLQNMPDFQTGEISFNEEESILFINNEDISISQRNQESNPHKLLTHIFNAEDGLTTKYSYWEIANESFKDEYKDKNSWRRYYRACKDIQEKIAIKTGITDFLIYTSGKKGSVQINAKYLN